MRRRRRRDEDEYDDEYGPKKGRSPSVVLAIVVGSAVIVLGLPIAFVVVCAGFLSMAGNPRPVKPSSTMPELVIGDDLKRTGMVFGEWREDVFTYTTTIFLPVSSSSRSLRSDCITVACFGPNGVKLRDGRSSHPAFKAGESAKLDLHFSEPKREIARIVLDVPQSVFRAD